MRRRVWMGVLTLAVASAAAAQPARGPLRNLQVELRWTEAQEATGHLAGARGDVVVGTGGQVDVHGRAVLRSGRRDEQTQTVQRLTVLNGGRAGVHLGGAVPLQWLDVALTPRGPVGVLRQGWVETGSSFELRPQWPGGDAPVTVELAHQSGGSGGALQREGVFTTLQLPLGEWVTVAQSGQTRQSEARGTLSSRDAERHTRRLLQMRVSAP
ncbi:MAG: hypothetical protein ACOZJZ_03920 [Pseudomonadota bacterium]